MSNEAPGSATQGIEELTVAQCWGLLQGEDLGRLAVDNIDGAPDLFPVNYLVGEEKLYLRSAPGRKLRSIARNPHVAFEVDGQIAGIRWSVVVRGTAERMNVDADIEASGIHELVSASPTSKDNFIRITPSSVSGRRFRVPPRPRRADSASPPSSVENEPGQEHPRSGGTPRSGKPHPIPTVTPRPAD